MESKKATACSLTLQHKNKMNLLSSLDSRRVGTITFNRPEVHNAFSTPMWQELPQRINALLEQQVRLIVFTGAGSSFAAGADFNELKAINSKADAERIWDSIAQALESIALAPVPTVAMVNGPCLGGGCLIATACDLRLAADRAIFGIPVAKLAIKLNQASVQRLVALVGPGQAKRLLYTADTIDSATAKAIGLVEEVVASNYLQAFTEATIEKILGNSPEALLALKANCRITEPAAKDQVDEREQIIGSYLSKEFRERLAAQK
jgi:enoyl-CoA hydratase/carnithine racemase